MIATILCIIPTAFMSYDTAHAMKLCEQGRCGEAIVLAEAALDRSRIGLRSYLEATMLRGCIKYKTGQFDYFYGDYSQVQSILSVISPVDKSFTESHPLYTEMTKMYTVVMKMQEEMEQEKESQEHKHKHHHHHEESNSKQSGLEHNP